MPDSRDMSIVLRLVDRTLESVKNSLRNAILQMSEPQVLAAKDNLLFCPACDKFFSDEHAERKPNFCENCGQAFEWADGQ